MVSLNITGVLLVFLNYDEHLKTANIFSGDIGVICLAMI